MANVFDQFDEPSSGNVFDRFDTPTVQPGDVTARKQQVEAQAAAEGPNKVREDLGFFNELGEGVGKVAKNILPALDPRNLVPEELSVAGVLNVPAVQTALGAAQVAGAPFAPLSNLASRAGEKVADLTGSDVAGALVQSAGEVLAPGAIGKGFKAVKGAGVFNQPSNRTLAKQAAREGEAVIAASEKRATEAIEAAQGRSVAAREEARALAGEQTEKLTVARSAQEAQRESLESIAEAAKRNVPSKAEFKAIAGDELAEATGAKFKETYGATLQARRKEFNEAYESTLEKASGVESPAANYKATAEKVLGEKGVSRPLPTSAEKAAGRVKAALDVEDEAADQLDALTQGLKESTSPEQKKMLDSALGEFMKEGGLPAQPSVRDLILEQKRLRAGERAAYAAKNDNLGRQFRELQQSLNDDIEAAIPGITGEIAAVDARYAKEFVPYFGKQSVTRAIADQDPSRIAQAAIRPRSDPKAVEKITRTMELVDDPALRKEISHAHLNGLIDEASRGDNFRQAFVKGWERYTNPSGNNNKVLRSAYGEDYDSVNAVVNQIKNAKVGDLDKTVKDIVKAGESRLKKLPQEADIEAALTRSLKQARREETAATTLAKKTRDLDIKATKQRIEKDVEKLLGGPTNRVATRLQSIGSGVLVSGSLRGNTHTISVGGLLIMGAKAAGKLLETTRGRSVFKAILRGTPGTTQAAANARIASSLLNAKENE